VTDTTLSFGYNTSWTCLQCERSAINSVEVIPHVDGLWQWGGWGLRKKLFTWETGYIPKNGPGIRVILKEGSTDKETPYTFLCDEAEKVAKILQDQSR